MIKGIAKKEPFCRVVGSFTFYFLRNTEVDSFWTIFFLHQKQVPNGSHLCLEEMSAILVAPPTVLKVQHPAWSVVMKRMMDGQWLQRENIE